MQPRHIGMTLAGHPGREVKRGRSGQSWVEDRAWIVSQCEARSANTVELLIAFSGSAMTRRTMRDRASRNLVWRSVPDRAFAVLAQHVVECFGHQCLEAPALPTR
jgi:hypothetical protein